MLPAWEHTLQVEPQKESPAQLEDFKPGRGYASAYLKIRFSPEGTNQAQYFAPLGILTNNNPRMVVWIAEEKPASGESLSDVVTHFLRRGLAVLVLNPQKKEPAADQTSIFYTAYNRTRVQEQVRDLLAICRAARTPQAGESPAFRVILAGAGRAGLWSLLAAPGADGVIADCDALDVADDEVMLQPDLFCPGIRNIGNFEGSAMLAAPNPLVLHNVGRTFPVEKLRGVYKAIGARNKLRIDTTILTPEHIALLASEM